MELKPNTTAGILQMEIFIDQHTLPIHVDITAIIMQLCVFDND